MAITAHQRISDRAGARGAVEFGGTLGFGHTAIIRAYLAATMESTLMELLLLSMVPVTVTLFAANFSGVF